MRIWGVPDTQGHHRPDDHLLRKCGKIDAHDLHLLLQA